MSYSLAPSRVVVNVSEFFGINSVTATMDWTQENNVTYNISIFPQISTAVEWLGSSSVQLTLLYNTHYHVSVVATLTHCEKTTTFIPLHYGEIYFKIMTLMI